MTIALATIKAALKIDYTDDDTELERIRDAAVAWVEQYCGFSLASASRTMYLRDWKDTVFAVQPVTALTSVGYTDTDGNPATLVSGTDYYWDQSGPVSVVRMIGDRYEMDRLTSSWSYTSIEFKNGHPVLYNFIYSHI